MIANNNTYFGYLLCSSPTTRTQELEHGLILIVSHTPEIAIGIQINEMIPSQSIQGISERIGIPMPGDDPLWIGGSSGHDRVHVIHTTDWAGRSTVSISDDLSITNDISVLSALSAGEGPSKFRACAGFWSWSGRELSHKLTTRPSSFDNTDKISKGMSWEIVPATCDLVLSDLSGHAQWKRAIEASAHHQASLWF
jgi:putative AlgH/UPF0301 family transcriptional regulator